jgi:hypothetical protein
MPGLPCRLFSSQAVVELQQRHRKERATSGMTQIQAITHHPHAPALLLAHQDVTCGWKYESRWCIGCGPLSFLTDADERASTGTA